MPGRFDPNSYVDVQERINRFWSEHPNGAIFTELDPSSTFDAVVFRALVFKERPVSGGAFQNTPDATGYASEMKGGVGANTTSWHENGETSAIGRALANMGYATTREDRPSRQEMAKVARHNVIPREAAAAQRVAGPEVFASVGTALLEKPEPAFRVFVAEIDGAKTLDELGEIAARIRKAKDTKAVTEKERDDLLDEYQTRRRQLSGELM